MISIQLLFLLPLCQLLQWSLAQSDGIIFGSSTTTTTTTATSVPTTGAQQCLCYLGSSCPSGTGGIDIRIVNTGNVCPSGYVFCCSSGGTTSGACGIRKITPGAHPVGQAAFGAYPWQVALLTNDNNYVGGGVLISSTHVLTVAHKVAPYINGGIKARLGAWDAQSTSEPYVDISISKVTMHPQYNSQNLQNDIAVLKLSAAAPIATASNINTACLPTGVPAAGTRCWVTGWGKDAFGPNGKYQSILKEVDVPILSQENCQTALRKTRLGELFVLSNSFMCAGGEMGKDACTGDGGSPLVCSTNNGPYQVVGLVTWGIGCAGAGIPGAYTNVFNFLPWVVQQMT